MFRRDNELIIEVIDNGVGIERRIFEELFLEELKSEKSNYPEDLKLTGRVGIDIFNFYARLLIAELGGNIVIDAFHPKSKANKLTYRSDSDIKIRKSRRKEQGTSIRFTLPGFFAKGTEPDLSFGQSLPVIGKADKKSVLDEGIATAFYAIDAAA